MNKMIYSIEPVFEERIWGTQEIRERFGYETDLENIAEVYNVVGQKDHLDNFVTEAGMYLSDFYKQNKELFDCECKDMPVMVCMAFSDSFLSIQIHPDDEYGMLHEGGHGRPEGWVIYDGPENNDLILGHNAQTKEEFVELSNQRDWNKLIRHVNMKRETQYVHVPAGSLHAFCKDALAIAFSTNGDITYRLYDYDRVDTKTGKLRPLHVQQVFDCIKVPDLLSPYDVKPEQKEGYKHTLYYDNPGEYTCGRLQIENKCTIDEPKFMFYTCASGKGTIGGREIKAGETLFVPAGFGKVDLSGEMDLVYITYKSAK